MFSWTCINIPQDCAYSWLQASASSLFPHGLCPRNHRCCLFTGTQLCSQNQHMYILYTCTTPLPFKCASSWTYGRCQNYRHNLKCWIEPMEVWIKSIRFSHGFGCKGLQPKTTSYPTALYMVAIKERAKLHERDLNILNCLEQNPVLALPLGRMKQPS